MTTLIKKSNGLPHSVRPYETPQSLFDLFFKNFFEEDSWFVPLSNTKISYPVDVYKDGDNLHFELAAVGVDKEDIKIEVSGENLRITYSKENEENQSNKEYVHKGIARREFDFVWKVPSEFDLEKLSATMDKGLLKINIPKSENKKAKTIAIK